MEAAVAPIEVEFKSILYLTDFSQPSEAALPLALAAARRFGAIIHALNVLIPPENVCTTPDLTAAALAAEEGTGIAEMRKVETRLAGVPHDGPLG